MTSKQAVTDFLAQPSLAVVGVSRSGKHFGNAAYRELKSKGYRLYPVHPEAEVVEGDRCYPDFASLPEPVGGALIVVPPEQTERVVRAAAEAGIRRLWLQQGAQSPAAIRFCEENGITAVHGECILMFAEPTHIFHRAHRAVWGLLGKLPN